ncbi:hypothetical protein GCM10027440_18670 [Nocardiopsis coralliicola]
MREGAAAPHPRQLRPLPGRRLNGPQDREPYSAIARDFRVCRPLFRAKAPREPCRPGPPWQEIRGRTREGGRIRPRVRTVLSGHGEGIRAQASAAPHRRRDPVRRIWSEERIFPVFLILRTKHLLEFEHFGTDPAFGALFTASQKYYLG